MYKNKKSHLDCLATLDDRFDTLLYQLYAYGGIVTYA